MNTGHRLLPREYGAYAELAFPLLTAFLAGGVTVAGLAFTLAVVAWFLVREPLAVLNGVRGARLEASLGGPARWAAWLLGLVGAAAAAVGIALATPPARLWALVPGVFVVPLAPALLRGQPKSLGAELLVAVALSSMVLPVGLAGRMSVTTALQATAVWGVSFNLATLAVHAIKARARPAHGAAWTVWATPVLTAMAAVCGLGAAVAGWWPWAAGAAVLPGAIVAAGALLLGTHPRRLKRVGWSLVAADVLTLALLLA